MSGFPTATTTATATGLATATTTTVTLTVTTTVIMILHLQIVRATCHRHVVARYIKYTWPARVRRSVMLSVLYSVCSVI